MDNLDTENDINDALEQSPVIEVLYQDEYFVIVNKPSGLLVHAYKECTDQINLMKLVRLQTGHYLYPLHRIDRPVSGIVIFGINKEASSKLKDQWHEDSTEKEYIVLVRGEILESGTFNFALSNDKKIKQDAVTHYTPIKNYGDWNTLLKVNIDTGRKHQIRRHFSRRCHQVIGDTAHGKGKINRFFREHYNLKRIFLHSHRFKFEHPITKVAIEINCPLPAQLESTLIQIEENLLIETNSKK
jgi:RluA family pseudouridine synthase